MKHLVIFLTAALLSLSAFSQEVGMNENEKEVQRTEVQAAAEEARREEEQAREAKVREMVEVAREMAEEARGMAKEERKMAEEEVRTIVEEAIKVAKESRKESTFSHEVSDTKTHTFKLGANPALEVENKYGNIIVSEWDKPELQMVVERKATSSVSQEAADKRQSCIKIDVQQNGSTVKAVTTIECNDVRFSGDGRFEITYTIFAPKQTAYKLAQKYGSVVLKGDISGALSAEIEYGNLTAETLERAAKVNVKYGNANITQVPKLDLELKYGNATLHAVEQLTIISGYANLELSSVKTIKGESKYDKYKVGSVEHGSMEMKYTDMKIQTLERELSIATRYGAMKVDNVASSFSILRIDGEYTDIKLGLETEKNVAFDIRTEYAKISIPSSWEKATSTLVKDGKERHAQGATGSGAKLQISSRYGNVSIK